MMQRLWGALFALVAVFVLSGCETAEMAGRPPAPNEMSTAGVPVEIRFAPADKLRITVFGEDRLTGEYTVDASGYVSLPLAGSVKAAGLTKPELEDQLAKKLRGDYLRNPKVTVEVMTFRPFYVLGEVEKPGQYEYKSGLNVLSAIAVAGGASYRASKSRVLIQRNSAGPFIEYPMSPTVAVYPGDLVRVPERYF